MSTRTTIFKYALKVGETTHDMPEGATILSVQLQHDCITLWALVVEGRPLAQRKFSVFGTGHKVPYGTGTKDFLGTVQVGPLVWHVFETGW